MGIAEWIGLLALLVAAYGVWHTREQTRMMRAQAGAWSSTGAPWWRSRPIIALFILAVAAWGAAGFDYYDRRHGQVTTERVIGTYGMHGPLTFGVTVNTKSLLDQKDKQKLVLIIRFDYANIDRMTDRAIEKSGPYTITGDPLQLGVERRNPTLLRFNNFLASVVVEYDVVTVPNKFSIEQVKSLADVESLGGRIVDSDMQVVPFLALGVQAVPPPGSQPPPSSR